MGKRSSLEDDLTEAAMLRAGEEVLRCPKCRKAILDDVPICRSCGTRFGRYAPGFPIRPVVIAAIVVILIIALLMFS